MKFNLGSAIHFLGKMSSEAAKELAKAQNDRDWHRKHLQTALREAARGHSRDTIIRDHMRAIEKLDALIKKLSK